MPAPKKPVTFDEHLGSLVGNLARGHGGREMLTGLLPWSRGTVNRRLIGETPFTVTEIEVVAKALNTTSLKLTEQALANYAGGTAEEGLEKLVAEYAKDETAPMSAPVISLDARRKTPATMTDDELEAELNAASTDPEHRQDEPDTP